MAEYNSLPYNLTSLRKLVDAAASSYPTSVHVGHDLLSIAEWKRYDESIHEAENGTVAKRSGLLFSLLASYFCIGNGGSVAVDLLLQGGTWQLFKSDKIAKYWVACFLSIYATPFGNLLYKSMVSARHPIRLLVVGLDEIDAVSSFAGAMDKAQHMFPANPMSPWMAGILMQRGGALFRYVESISRGTSASFPFNSLDFAMKKALFYVTLYWAMPRAGIDKLRARWWITIFAITRALVIEVSGNDALGWMDDNAVDI